MSSRMSRISIFLFILSLGLLANSVILIYRIDLAERLNYDPTTVGYITYDMTTLDQFAFYTDEINYYNFSSSRTIFEDVSFRITGLFAERILRSINVYGYYIQFIRKLTRSWENLFFFCGVLSYLLFSYLVFRCLDSSSRRALIVYCCIILSPTVLMLSASWLRDLFILSAILSSILSASKKNYFLLLASAFFLLILRAYLAPLAFLSLLVFSNPEEDSMKKQIFAGGVLISAIVVLFLWLYSQQQSLSTLFDKISPRLIQNFSGLTYGFLTGYHIPKLAGNLGDLESLGYYYTIITYVVLYIVLIIRRHSLRHNPDFKRWLALTIMIGVYITILHSTTLGFFTNRIILITWIMAMITLGKVIIPGSAVSNKQISSN